MTDSINIGVSSCLMGEHAPCDDGHKHDDFLQELCSGQPLAILATDDGSGAYARLVL
ncbi:MAG: hypothetical protein HXX11_11945 [Desulfuromonadales bacterium]|nr:hypothetical protein [Desulfuromonadales bacterium]